jgi:general secretion pathway protein C
VGLRPGDVVTSVNGIPLSDPTQMGQLFEQLSSARRLDVTVERGGRQSRLSLELE